MTYNSLPGLKFTETVATASVVDVTIPVPLFIVQTSSTITDLDGQITYYTGMDAFNELISGKGLTYTAEVIADTLIEYGNTAFYVYSIKTDTTQGFTDAVKATAHLLDVNRLIYIEETKSANANTVINKIAAIKAGLIDNASNGVFRTATIIPYGTVDDAVSNASSGTDEANCISSLTTILTATGNGRIEVALPDENAGIILGKCMSCDYADEPGRTPVDSAVHESSYNFDATQMLTLMNLGVLFLKPERSYGEYRYRICLGVNTGFKNNTADGLIVCRTVVDELLRRISYDAAPFVKAKETQQNEVLLQSIVDGIVDEFVTADNIYRDGTTLTVSGDGTVFQINGEIKPVRSAIAIEVNTTIQ